MGITDFDLETLFDLWSNPEPSNDPNEPEIDLIDYYEY
jgi:hypothetical protein